MIPKIIHYCWFGKKKQPDLLKNCIRSWKQHLPGYEIKCWNEGNIPLNHPFIKAALKEKYFAFAADLIRFLVVEQYGGIYLDTDVLVLKSFDDLLTYDLFLGEEVPGRMNFAVFGAIPNHPVNTAFVKFYNNTTFNSANLPIISFALTAELIKLKPELANYNYKIFDADSFYPLPFEKKLENYQDYITTNTYAVHLWNHSWRAATEYILERKYREAFNKIINELIHNRSARFSRSYYYSLLRHFKLSLQKNKP